MSETYTVGGDTLYKIDDPNFLGQTFRPLESHTLDYIDLEMRGPLTTPQPQIRVFHAGADHKPVGDDISVSAYLSEKKCGLFTTGRARFRMTPVVLNAGDYYVMTMRNDIPLGGASAWCQYDADGAAYARGVRISSPDWGATWTVHPDSDCIFTEFGDPYLPKPEPPPPISNFAIPTICYTVFQDAVYVVTHTTVPCHLTLFWTDKPPLKHPQYRILRGLRTSWGTYFCFVAWHAVEQMEAGDTLYHCFKVLGWPPKTTYWFTFRGDVDLERSPSVGPIFSFAYDQAYSREIILRPSAAGDVCTIYGAWPWACPDHWKSMNEVIPDGWTTRVGMYWPFATNWKRDLYKIPHFTTPAIDRITLHNVLTSQGTRHTARVAKHLVKTHGTEHGTASFSLPDTWVERTWVMDDNPHTGLRWTQEELDDLQIGLWCSTVHYVGYAQTSYGTNTFITVRRGVNCLPYIVD